MPFESLRPGATRINTVARVLLLLEKDDPSISRDARAIAAGIGIIAAAADESLDHSQIAAVLQASLRDCFAESPVHPAGPAHEDALFIRQDDYWNIAWHGHRAHLKCTRGLHCLAFLLQHPGREFHVTELLAHGIETPASHARAIAINGGNGSGNGNGDDLIVAGLYNGDVVLDATAKAQIKRHLAELREEHTEAEQRNDSHRAAAAQEEMAVIIRHLASAIGLGGRDRRTGSDAERARSAVTKRIKDAIHKIAEAIPALGDHLSTRIKTGYFCTYPPHPERPVVWKF